MGPEDTRWDPGGPTKSDVLFMVGPTEYLCIYDTQTGTLWFGLKGTGLSVHKDPARIFTLVTFTLLGRA